MLGIQNAAAAPDAVVHIIQVALTPIFLLTGIATLLNVFSTRLARVADRVEAVGRALEEADPEQAGMLALQLVHLHRRSVALDIAVVLGAIGGAATCGAVLALFLSYLLGTTIATVLLGLFGLAVISALGAIIAYTAEMLMAGTGIRAEVAQSRAKPAGRPTTT
jgi:type IV secretory pathway VirB6-like protein